MVQKPDDFAEEYDISDLDSLEAAVEAASPAQAHAPAGTTNAADGNDDGQGSHRVHPPRRTVHQSHEADQPHDVHGLLGDINFSGQQLEAPEPRPGMVQRWIRVGFRDGTDDARNYSRALRFGWKPRPIGTIPADFAPLGAAPTGQGGALRVSGLILCERPIAIHEQHKAEVQDRNRKHQSAVDAQLGRVQVAGHPILHVEDDTRVIGAR